MPLELSENFLSQAAGWDVMKQARLYLEQDKVLSSNWSPPLLRGVVQDGETSYRASLVVKSPVDLENLCHCREAREWGKICSHVVAVGLHWLKSQKPEAAKPNLATAPPKKGASLRLDPSGDPAELFLILPPNLEQSVARGKIMLVFEVTWSGKRLPLNSLPAQKTFAFPPRDVALLERLQSHAPGEIPAILQLDTAAFAELLPLLAGHPNVSLGKSSPVEISKKPMPLPLRATLEANGEIVVALEGKLAPMTLLGNWVWQKPTLQPLGLPAGFQDLLRGPLRIPRLRVPAFLAQMPPSVQSNFKLEDFSLEPQPPRFSLELTGGLAQLAARLQCAYGARIMTVGVTAADENVWLPDPASIRRYSTRDMTTERAALARLQRGGWLGPDAQGNLKLAGQDAVLRFFAREFPALQKIWEVTLDERLNRSAAQNLERVEPRFQISSGTQWFDLGVVFAAPGGETFSAAEIQRLILTGQSHTRLKNGKFALLDTGAVEELQEVLLDCAPRQHEGGWRIQNTQSGFLESTLRDHPQWKVQAPPEWRGRAARQSGQAKLECPPLGDLENILRPYQKHGVAWLRFLRENNFGGILADEMGLGKTLQTLAFLRHLRQTEPGLLPMLIVCPTSLVFNWVAEAKKFTPGLKVLALHGPERAELFPQIPSSDLVVTSYALLRRDAEMYRGLEFDTLALDEAQHIKNRETQNAQSVKTINARHRLVLTGTPLENSVLDLWSIFDFLMPGYLGTARDFHERYEVPIVKEKSQAAQARLARRLRPFLLRRLKQEVAPDLPARLDHVSFCELTPAQRGVYQQVIEASRKEILDATGPSGEAKNRMLVLTALLRLRQVCCDLRLLKSDEVNAADASGKLDLFGELLEEALDGGHRVLVFSQFVSMLSIIRTRLDEAQVPYCYLDGSTADRAAVVSRFQNDPAMSVFLISLKAGGVGLNLTAADTVIHFDPWWNPAVEEQATARAHRIGQDKVVTSYKLIARDTVEEKILALQNRKREIIQASLGGEEAMAEALTWEEIQELLT